VQGLRLLLSIAAGFATETQLPGTQPNELALPPEASNACNCHASFTSDFIEPGKTYRATMMSLSARDPLFKTALAIAHDDRADLSDVCIRCHVPAGWLAGRSTPSDGSALTDDDLESITCDTCHRMVPTSTAVSPTQLIGDGQYTISPSTAKRAHRGIGPSQGHRVIQSDFIQSSEMCGACHSLFNPTERAHTADGTMLPIAYYEQRTYEEWADSSMPASGKTCVGCHFERGTGKAAREGEMIYPDLAIHLIVGGNFFSPAAVNLTDPLFPVGLELPHVIAAVDDSLRSAAKLVVTSTLARPISVRGRDAFAIALRLTNLTGHKLPTGYPEGRRVYLEVSLFLAGTGTVAVSGRWDPASGNVIDDPQLRTYETKHGRIETGQAAGERTHHLAKMNQVLTDTRIPPEGFMPRAADMVPAGRDYGSGPYRNYDDVSYTVTAPDVARTSTGTLTIRAKYQVTDGEVVDFLVTAAGRTSSQAMQLQRAWDGLDHAPPRTMAEIKLPVVVEMAPPVPDAGEIDAAADAGTMESGALGQVDASGGAGDSGLAASGANGGCSCREARDAPEPSGAPFENEAAVAIAALMLFIRPRRSLER
jgi:hypothetical protein